MEGDKGGRCGGQSGLDHQGIELLQGGRLGWSVGGQCGVDRQGAELLLEEMSLHGPVL